MRRLLFGTLLGFSLLASACGDDDVTPPPTACEPSEAQWNDEIQPLVTEYCGLCHGATPSFGAPFSLTEHASIVAGSPGRRVVDRMATALESEAMPPINVPQPTAAERQRIIDWATCVGGGDAGVMDASVDGSDAGVMDAASDVPADGESFNPMPRPFPSPQEDPSDLNTIDLVIDNFAVPVSSDHYEERTFRNLTQEDVFVRRFNVIIDESRVLHHLTLRFADGGGLARRYLYTWAPGTGAMEFPEGGVRLRPDDALILELHYNNAAEIAGLTDSSGVRLFVAPPSGQEYEMRDWGPGAFGFSIAPRGSTTITGSIAFQGETVALTTMPHMHEIGQSFQLVLTRANGAEHLLMDLERWDFETQPFYDFPIVFQEGDSLEIRCDYDNPNDFAVNAGPRTQDEMCYAFTYVELTDAGSSATELSHSRGACFEGGSEMLEGIGGMLVPRSAEPQFEGSATIPDGSYTLEEFIIATDNNLLTFVTFTGAAQAQVAGSDVNFDGAFHLIAPVEDLENGFQQNFSLGGTLQSTSGPSLIDQTCPEVATPNDMTFGARDGKLLVRYAPSEFSSPDVNATMYMVLSR